MSVMVVASGTAGRVGINITASSRRLTSHVLQHLRRARQALRTSAEIIVSGRPRAQRVHATRGGEACAATHQHGRAANLEGPIVLQDVLVEAELLEDRDLLQQQ